MEEAHKGWTALDHSSSVSLLWMTTAVRKLSY
jgi:hypothetical protein